MRTPQSAITTNLQQIRDFLSLLGDGYTTLVCIPNTNAAINAKTFELPAELDAASNWAVSANKPGVGVYWTVNPSKTKLNKKPKKVDISHGRLLHRDVDPSKDASIPYQDRRAQILRQIEVFKETEPVPSILIDSGHGCYPIYLLNKPANLIDTEVACKHIGKNDNDGTWNCERLLRLPGTINWPSRIKVDQYGYPDEATMCSVIATSENRYAIEDFLPSARINKADSNLLSDTPIDLNSLPQGLQTLVLEGAEVGSRSEKFHYVVLELNRLGYSDDQITALLSDYPNGIAEKYIDRLEGEVDRSLSKSSLNNPLREDLFQLINETNDIDTLIRTVVPKIAGARLSESDLHRLLMKLKDKTGIPINTLKKDVKSFSGEQYISADLECAKSVIDLIGLDNFIHQAGSLWKWSGSGVWKSTDDVEIKQVIQRVGQGKRINKAFISSVLDLVKTEVNDSEIIFNPETSSINCKNGELEYSKELGIWQLVAHDKKHFRTTLIPIEHDNKATAPRFSQFLREVFKEDADADAKVAVVEEALGYSLTTTTHLERFFVLIGVGANGKSVLLSVLHDLLGKAQTCAVQPSSFDSSFHRAHLHGKLANVITEIAQGAVIADDKLKSLVSGELTTAENKFKPLFDFRPFAKHWFGTNHLPHTKDFSEALFRRAILLTFNNKFEGSNRDVHLIEKLRLELPGILNLALSGLSRLNQNGEFTYCPSSEEAKRDWRKEVDQASQFVDAICEVGQEFSCTSKELFQAYSTWAESEGIRSKLYHRNFSNRLQLLGYGYKKGTKGTRMLLGIRVKEEDDFLK